MFWVQFANSDVTIPIATDGCVCVGQLLPRIRDAYPDKLKNVDYDRIILRLPNNEPLRNVSGIPDVDPIAAIIIEVKSAAAVTADVVAPEGKEYRHLSPPPLYRATVRPKTPPPTVKLPPGWPVVNNSARERIEAALKTPNRISLMVGRRRIGKTHEVLAICNELHRAGLKIIFIEAKVPLSDFHRIVCDALFAFDPQIEPPAKNVDAIFGVLWWLLLSGVRVVIDEIQRLYTENKGFFTGFKTGMSFGSPLLGSFLGFGSHVTEVIELVGSATPMYLIGVTVFDFLQPKPHQILNFFHNLGIPQRNWLAAYAFGGCIIGKYSEYLKVISPDLTFPLKSGAAAEFFQTQKLITEVENDRTDLFVGELGQELGSFLKSMASFKSQDCTDKVLPTKMNTEFGFNTPQTYAYIRTLERYSFIKREMPVVLPGRKTAEEERFTITDPRMRMEKILVEQKTLDGKINAWEIEEGKILEGVVNEIIAERSDESVYVATKDRYWSDKSQKGTVEIDVVVQSKMWGYLWGSLKRNPKDLAPENFLPHLANVLQQLDNPAAVNHGLLFISTVLDGDTRKKLMQAPFEIGGKILARIQCFDLKDLIDETFVLYENKLDWL